VEGIEDIGEDELIQLRGLANSIKDGEISIESAFRDTNGTEPSAGAKDINAALNTGSGSSGETKAAAPTDGTVQDPDPDPLSMDALEALARARKIDPENFDEFVGKTLDGGKLTPKRAEAIRAWIDDNSPKSLV